MKSKKLSILLAVLALVISTLACAAGELSLENPRMSKDDSGDQAVTSFSSSDVFYVVADLNNAPAGTIVEAKWYVVNVPGYDSGLVETDASNVLTVSESEAPFTGTLSFSLTSLDGGWPAGGYRVELYLNNVLTHTVDFSVQ